MAAQNSFIFRNNFNFKPNRQAWIKSALWKSGFARRRLHNSYFNEIRPILVIIRILGRFPLGITADGVQPFRIWSLPAIYCLIVYIFICILTINTLMELIEMLKDSPNYDHSLQLLMVISYISQNLLIPVTYWQKANQIVEYIGLWSRFESEYTKEFSPLRLKKWIIGALVFFPIWGVLYCLRMHWLIGIRMSHCFVFFVMIFASDLLSLFWITTQYEIRQQARKLSDIISSEGILKDKERKRYCWLTLSCLTSSLGDVIGLAAGSLLTSLFFAFLISCYGRLTSFMDRIKRSEYVWGEFLESASIYIYFFIMFDSSERTTIELGEKFSSMILNLKHPKMDKETLDDVSLFLSCISAFPPTTTFGGFLVVDRRLLTSFISNAVTYLVMLFQYRRE